MAGCRTAPVSARRTPAQCRPIVVVRAHRLLCHSTLGVRVRKKKKRHGGQDGRDGWRKNRASIGVKNSFIPMQYQTLRIITSTVVTSTTPAGGGVDGAAHGMRARPIVWVRSSGQPEAGCMGDRTEGMAGLLHINVQRFRGGLVFKAHRLCVSLNSRLESNKEEEKKEGGSQDGTRGGGGSRSVRRARCPPGTTVGCKQPRSAGLPRS